MQQCHFSHNPVGSLWDKSNYMGGVHARPEATRTPASRCTFAVRTRRQSTVDYEYVGRDSPRSCDAFHISTMSYFGCRLQ